MAEVRRKYWIIGVMALAKGTGRNCVVCKRWPGRACEQMMSSLPQFRMTPGQPFENTARDYFVPFDMKYGYRGRRKAYGAVFSCLTTRAVHIELLTNLSTDRFLLGLRRFMSWYGTPKFLRSGNGRNFVGAARELRLMLKSWKEAKRKEDSPADFCAANKIKWTFSTPLASHHNGAI